MSSGTFLGDLLLVPEEEKIQKREEKRQAELRRAADRERAREQQSQLEDALPRVTTFQQSAESRRRRFAARRGTDALRVPLGLNLPF